MKNKFLGNITLALVVFLTFSMLSDRFLGLLGMPKAPPAFAHPPNITEERRNLDFTYTFRTNSQGLKYREIPLEKQEGETRVLVVGDSFVEGYGVDTEETFSSLLEREFSNDAKPVRFINGGLSATGPLEYGKLFYHVGQRYDPDALILCIYANDVWNTLHDSDPAEIYSGPRAGLHRLLHLGWPRIYTRVALWKQHERTRPEDFVEAVAQHARDRGISEQRIQEWRRGLPGHLVEATNRQEFNGAILSTGLLSPEAWVESLDIEGELAEQRWQTVSAILDEVRSIAEAQGIWMGVVYIPARFQYDPAPENPDLWRLGGSEIRDRWLEQDAEVQSRLASWARSSDIPFWDLTPVFRQAIQSNANLNWHLDGHWSPTGHLVAAQSLAEWLDRREQIGLDRLPPRRLALVGNLPGGALTSTE